MSPQPTGKSWIEHPVYAFVKGGFESGLSGNQILSSLKEAGAGFRRTDFYAMLADVRGFYVHQDRIKFTPRSLKIDPANYTQASSTARDKYTYEFQAKGYKPGQEGVGIQTFRVGSSEPITIDQAFQQAETAMTRGGGAEKYGVNPAAAVLEENYNVIGVYVRPDAEFGEGLW